MNDPIERLRAADPVPGPVSHPSDGPVRATLEEILMTDTATPPRADDDHVPGRPAGPWFRSPRILAVAAALLLVVGVAGAALVGGGSSDEPADVAQPTAPVDGPDTGVSPGDSGATQQTACVELYGIETLPNREYAFDGTVVSVDGDDMTFEVHEWFAGGEGTSVTLDHQGYAGMLFAPEGPALEPGTRVLAAGDGGFVWSCGFTQLHDPAVADQWRSALAG